MKLRKDGMTLSKNGLLKLSKNGLMLRKDGLKINGWVWVEARYGWAEAQ